MCPGTFCNYAKLLGAGFKNARFSKEQFKTWYINFVIPTTFSSVEKKTEKVLHLQKGVCRLCNLQEEKADVTCSQQEN